LAVIVSQPEAMFASPLLDNCEPLQLLKNKGLKEEKKAKVGLDAIDTSTTLESNKSPGDI
jgi:hypothetical protein